ncbi:hypothetical protein HH800_16620 [Sphingobium yanoikuyae]|uniref:Uncharacterized protein n=1 Tax=Sphingobium yanoikuyae TaxID=13690 RepID=A0A6M4GBI0_SPHYA|nr:hypothetical protein [Sphingobium yanoikuyae]QJR03663.1 hypothetical protein HH800_16620 [Sphingobium yanoikuyae]
MKLHLQRRFRDIDRSVRARNQLNPSREAEIGEKFRVNSPTIGKVPERF